MKYESSTVCTDLQSTDTPPRYPPSFYLYSQAPPIHHNTHLYAGNSPYTLLARNNIMNIFEAISIVFEGTTEIVTELVKGTVHWIKAYGTMGKGTNALIEVTFEEMIVDSESKLADLRAKQPDPVISEQ